MLRISAASMWVAAVIAGFSRLWAYGDTPGVQADLRTVWPTGTRVQRAESLPTFVMLLHPHCPCSRASVEELAKLMARCQGRLLANVVMVRPAGTPEGW